MKKSRRRTNIIDRWLNRSPSTAGAKRRERRSSAGSLFEAAGHVPQSFETLERRELLFVLTVDPSDPSFINEGNGYGTVEAAFAYFIPYIFPSAAPTTSNPQTITEDFNEDDPGVPPLNVNTPFAFQGSNLRITSTASSIILEREVPGATAPPNQLRAGLQNGQTIFFQAGTDTTLNSPTVPLTSFSLDIGGSGIDINNFTVELVLEGNVVRTFTGADLGQANVTTPGSGIGRFVFNAPANGGFNGVRFTSSGNLINNFTMDNVQFVIPANPFVSILEPTSRYGAVVRLTGPLGASADVRTLYNEAMTRTLAIGKPETGEFLIGDPDGNGVPNINNGIGSITLNGTDRNTTLSVIGGIVEPVNGGGAGAYFVQGGFALSFPDSIEGLYGEMESAGFGFRFFSPGPNQILHHGMPGGAAGSVVIGSPYVRDLNNYNPAGQIGQNPVSGGWTRSDQGIIVNGSIGAVTVYGMLMGTSQFKGSVDRLNVTTLMGSVNVAGDLGSLVVAGDAGVWEYDPGVNDPSAQGAGPMFKTGGKLNVGRSLGSVDVGGRGLMDVTVVGNTTDPVNAPARQLARYYEKEITYDILVNTPDGFRVTLTRSFISSDWVLREANTIGTATQRIGQAPFFGNTMMRNDSIRNAEWIGSLGTGVTIYGDLGFRDPINQGDDPVDVYAFASDGTQEIVAELTGTLGNVYAKLVDSDGRMLATFPAPNDPGFRTFQFRHKPNGPGVYYLVVQTFDTDQQGDPFTSQAYFLSLVGMASTTFGSFRAGAGIGSGEVSGFPGSTTPMANDIIVLSGSMGAIRAGTGFVQGDNTEADSGVVFNDNEGSADNYNAIGALNLAVPNHLYGILAGDDIEGAIARPVIINVGGNLGTVRTGMRTNIDPEEGDLRNARFIIGGSIGSMDLRGSIGIDQDQPVADPPPDLPNSVQITTGNKAATGLRGDIGIVRVGSHVGGDTTVVKTSPGSIITGFLVAQDRVGAPTSSEWGVYGAQGTGKGIDFQLGFGSDLRFFDSPQLDLLNSADAFVFIPLNTPVLFTDDAGGTVSVRVVGNPGTGASALVRQLPIAGSKGVAIGRIEANLIGGAQLVIEGQGPGNATDVISIGHIVVTGADNNAGIQILGNAQIDVWRIDVNTGDTGTGVLPFQRIVNSTPNGDIVAVDANTLDSIEVQKGDLGRTQVVAWGPSRIGPYMGLIAGLEGPVGSPITVGSPNAEFNGQWNGQIFRPIPDANDETSFLEEVGSPIDPYLDGVIVRGTSVTRVQAGGAIGDVLVPSQNIVEVIANFDAVTAPGRFDGIIGNIYSTRISRVDIGDGVAQRQAGPFADVSIVARDDIFRIVGDRIANANISGLINARNVVAGNTDPNNFPTDGIDSITLSKGGDFIDVYIGAMNVDDFWINQYSQDDAFYFGTINNLQGTDADFVGSNINAFQVNTIRLTNGFYDASQAEISNTVQLIEAAGYRNSSIDGSNLEYRRNFIRVEGDIQTIRTIGDTGDMADLLVEATGRVQRLSAFNFSRVIFKAALGFENIIAAGSMRASEISGARINNLTVTDSIRASEISISGPMQNVKVDNQIVNSLLEVRGPDGRIDKITVKNGFTGTVQASGPIDTIEVTNGDLATFIKTTTDEGDIKLLKASRDLAITTDIAGTVETFSAGRHIGSRLNPGVILVRGDVKDILAPNGQLYSDIRIGQTLTLATFGPVVNLPTNSIQGRGSLLAFGRIETVRIIGDWNGSIISYSGGIGAIVINDGSYLPGTADKRNLIAAFDGNLDAIAINRGDLLGDIHADYILKFVRVTASADGVFGDVGINPDKSANAGYNEFRNQLPPGLVANGAINGPRITAGWNLGRIDVVGGSMFETFASAGRAIGTIAVSEAIRSDGLTSGSSNNIAAGSSIFRVQTGLGLHNTAIVAGIRTFGADGRLGGTGADADTMMVGRIQNIEVGGVAANSTVSAGIVAGADGLYNTADDSVVIGNSFIRNVLVNDVGANFSVFSDRGIIGSNSGNFTTGGTNLPHSDPLIVPGGNIGTQIPNTGAATAFTYAGGSGTISFTGPGKVFFHAATGRLIVVNTTNDSNIVVNASGNGNLQDFNIVSNDDASIGTLDVNANLTGESNIAVDGFIFALDLLNVNSTGRLSVGNNIRTFTAGNIAAWDINLLYTRDFIVNGLFGGPLDLDDASLSIVAGMNVTVNGAMSGVMNVDRDLITGLTLNGGMSGGNFRAGASVPLITVGVGMDRSRISVRDTITEVVVNGTMNESVIMAGGDLGTDAVPGGSGEATDVATTGSIGKATIKGDFTRSSIVAGMIRGTDGYFGTSDDSAASGRSHVGDVEITGTLTGSNVFSEQYRITSTGTVGDVEIGGQPGQNNGNFQIGPIETAPLAIGVQSMSVIADASIFVASIFFNQAMDESSFSESLSIREIRPGPNNSLTLLPVLVEGVDYVLEYFAPDNLLRIIFSKNVTEANLPQQPNVTGPGVFRFQFNASTLRALNSGARLDGDGDGFSVAGDNYSQDWIVGDAGDKLVSEIITPVGQPRVDMYGPADLDLVLDNNKSPDGLPDVNKSIRLFGTVGDHQDQNIVNFLPGSDVDVYKITLQAGQILRLGAMEGSALFANRFLTDALGEIQGGDGATSLNISYGRFEDTNLTTPDTYLIKQTGVYYLIIDNTGQSYNNAGVIPNIDPQAGATGDYNFELEVFDDGDSGFKADTNSGNGTAVTNAPDAQSFAGNDGQLGTGDDLPFILTNDGFTFFYSAGADGLAGTADDVVSGNNGAGITSSRIGDKFTSTIESAIATPGNSGLASKTIAPDVDIYHLNGGTPIAPNARITVTVRLSSDGADLGSRREGDFFTNFAPGVKFGVFDVTNATNVGDGTLLFSPTDFKPTSRTPNTVVATDGSTTYGFDANGDFYISFVNPGRLGVSQAAPSELALYIQGVFRTDYEIDIVSEGTGTRARKTQNVLIETKGGVVDWLLANGRSTNLSGFDASVLGFSGSINGQKVNTYILQTLVSRLNSVFAAAGVDVNVSTNPIAFENQPYSKVFISNANDPVEFLNADVFGFSQRSDALNTDLNDEGVVFAPSMFSLDLSPDQAGVDAFVDSLSAAVGRRIGELMGLRFTDFDFANPIDIMSTSSVRFTPGQGGSYEFSAGNRELATQYDYLASTFARNNDNFFLGEQNAVSLLDKLLKD